jgi:hypothetical protein
VLGVGNKTVNRALRTLVALGVLVDCGETEPHRHYPRGTKLYAVGSRTLERQPPAVKVAVDEDPQPSAPDDGAVLDAELGVVAVAGDTAASGDSTAGQLTLHEPQVTPTPRCAIRDDR